MSVYYISNAGNDRNDGLSISAPWETIAKVNKSLKSGDTVLFRRGDTFYGRITPPRDALKCAPTVFGTYGDGEKPVVSQYKLANADGWEQSDEDVWRIDLRDISRFHGNTSNIDTNVGFLRVDGKIYPRKKFAVDTLEREWDFYNDDRYVYVKTGKKPSELAGEVCFACNIGCMQFADNIEVHEIIFRGTGGHGISGTVNGALISGCEFHEIGGSQLPGYPTPNTRYGNGVECWSNSSDVTVENCRFSGIYDVAITMQGNEVVKCWENMRFTGNVMWDCQQCFEIWSRGNLPATGFKDCLFENNVCLNSGFCWGYDVRPNKDCSSHLLIYGLECPLCGITVRKNVFANARVASLYKSGGPQELPDDYVITDNIFIIGKGEEIAFHGKCSDEEYNRFYKKIADSNSIVLSDNY